LIVNALGIGLALERNTDPDAVPAELFGDALVLLMRGLQGTSHRDGGDDGGD
jgi:hypothetical protein